MRTPTPRTRHSGTRGDVSIKNPALRRGRVADLVLLDQLWARGRHIWWERGSATRECFGSVSRRNQSTPFIFLEVCWQVKAYIWGRGRVQLVGVDGNLTQRPVSYTIVPYTTPHSFCLRGIHPERGASGSNTVTTCTEDIFLNGPIRGTAVRSLPTAVFVVRTGARMVARTGGPSTVAVAAAARRGRTSTYPASSTRR